MQGVTKMRKHIPLFFLFCFLGAAPAAAQTVLFDGLVLNDRQATALQHLHEPGPHAVEFLETGTARPSVVRGLDQCLTCHAGPSTPV